jgi:hypothetical protein
VRSSSALTETVFVEVIGHLPHSRRGSMSARFGSRQAGGDSQLFHCCRFNFVAGTLAGFDFARAECFD